MMKELVVGFAIMFILLPTILIFSSFGTLSNDLQYQYDYATVTNSTESVINATQNATYYVTIGEFSDIIEGQTPTPTVSVSVQNTESISQTVKTYANGVYIGSFTAIHDTTTTHTFSVSWLESQQNNISCEVV